MNTRRALSGATRAAWAVVNQNRWRSCLTLTVCGLGTAGVIIAGAMGRAQVVAMQERLDALGGRLIVISPNNIPPYPGRLRQLDHFISLEPEDGLAIAKIPNVKAVVPVVTRNSTLRLGRSASRIRLLGTSSGYAEVRGFTVAKGRFLTPDDEGHKVIVLGHAASTELAPRGVPPGSVLLLGGQPYQVIGVLQPLGVNFAGEDEDHQAFVPLETYRSRISNRFWLNHLYLQLSDEADSKKAVQQVLQLLRDRHARRTEEMDDVILRDMADVAQQQSSLSQAALRVVSISSAVLLVLGVAGIATLMIQVVRQRRAEFGLRRAVGARPFDVAVQLFLEGMGLALTGVLSGLALGLGVTILGRLLFGPAVILDMPLVVVTVLVSLIASGVACLVPAMIAARMEPAAALRS